MDWNKVMDFVKKGSPKPLRRVQKSNEEWAALLTPEEFNITREKGTEMAFTGEYCEAHAPGKYVCKCCGELLFDASRKFESHSGWPGFTEPVSQNAIKYERDMSRVEVMCNVCDGHLGHVFPDGPKPTGLRYCINSASVRLVD